MIEFYILHISLTLCKLDLSNVLRIVSFSVHFSISCKIQSHYLAMENYNRMVQKYQQSNDLIFVPSNDRNLGLVLEQCCVL